MEYETPVPVTTEVNSAHVEVGVPLKVGDGHYLIPGASYRLEAPRFVDPPEGAPPVARLHETLVSLSGLIRVSERWSLLAKLGGGLEGDLHAVDRDVVRLSGFVLASRHLSDRAQVGLGGTWTWAFGQPLALPILRLNWEVSPTFAIELLLPAHAHVVWRPHDRLRVGGFAELEGNEYAIRLPEILEGAACRGDGARSDCIDHLAYTDGNGGARVGARLVEALWLEARVGVSFFRRFELLNADDEPVSFGEQRLPSAPFVKVRLSYEY